MMQNKESDNRIQKILNDPEKVRCIIQEGIRAALLRHKQVGNPICEGKDGSVVWIPPEKI
jgi:hypothetical protein